MLDFLKSFILTPLSVLWEYVYVIRRFFYRYGFFKTNRFPFPVISVGNITFGGTGKTPFTIWLTEKLTQKSLRPVILTRGYRGKFEQSYGILEAKKSFSYNPVDYGDEPLLISRRLKEGAVIVGKKRSENLKYFINKLKPQVCILDDGYQHMKIERDLNICLFDALLPLSQYKVAPKGYLREGKTALDDADVIILSRADQVHPHKLKEIENHLSKFVNNEVLWGYIRYKTIGLFNANYEKVGDSSSLNGKNVIAVAAVANPTSFFSTISGLGGNLVEKLVYPDHYYFSLEDIEELVAKAEEKEALIVTSEKDIVKMRKISTEIEVYYLEITVEFLKGEAEIVNLLNQKID